MHTNFISNNRYSIACGIDSNYVEHLITMLNSLFSNNKPLKFRIFILSFDLTNDNKQIIKSWIENQKQEVLFIDINPEQLVNFPIFDDGYISPATYLRLFIPSLLPISIDKVLYLDSDIIVNTNIEKLLNTDISSYALAAVEDAPNNSVVTSKEPSQPYFNAGVLLLNLKKLRKIDFLNTAVEFIQKNKSILHFHDQDVLNALLGNQAKMLPIQWNMLDCFYNTPPKIQQKYLSALKNTNKKNCIIHFSGIIKPWHKASIHPLTRLYFKYKTNIKFSNLNNEEKWQHFNEIPRYRKLFIHIYLPIWLQRILDRQICWLWRALKL